MSDKCFIVIFKLFSVPCRIFLKTERSDMTYFVLIRVASRLHLRLLQQFELTKPTSGRLISLSIWDCYLSILCCNWIVGLYSASAHPPHTLPILG
jgi:hypothetical protein